MIQIQTSSQYLVNQRSHRNGWVLLRVDNPVTVNSLSRVTQNLVISEP